MPTGALLRVYLAATHIAAPLATRHLERRLRRGKESPERWREKLGEASLPRPDGPVVWMHAVGLGEVLALRGLIEAMHAVRPDLHFLVTSSARASGEVFARNRPPRTIHQFLPLDVPAFIARFLDHWRPVLSVWAEQDLWPGLVVAVHARGIPLAMVNARMNARAFAARRRAARAFAALYARFALIAAQDADTAAHMRALAPGVDVTVMGSLKAAGPALADAAEERGMIGAAIAGRKPWCAASTHEADEAVVLAAQVLRLADDPSALLILVPRVPARRDAIVAMCRVSGLAVVLRSEGRMPAARDAVWLADTFGELGLWYRLCPVSVIGGSFGETGGHNPWEAARLGSAVLHGPHTANFADDYAALARAGAARQVADADALAAALGEPGLAEMGARATALLATAGVAVGAMRDRLLSLLER